MYSRHTLLQCSYHQARIDKLAAGYDFGGDYDPEQILDIKNLVPIVVSDKLVLRGHTDVASSFSRHGVPDSPRPYFCFFFDMGCEANIEEVGCRTKLYVPPLTPTYTEAKTSWLSAKEALDDYNRVNVRKMTEKRKKLLKQLRAAERLTRDTLDACGRYVLHIRGLDRTTYGWVDKQNALQAAKQLYHSCRLSDAYDTLVSALLQSAKPLEDTYQARLMRPFRHHQDHSEPEAEWMKTFIEPNVDEMQVD